MIAAFVATAYAARHYDSAAVGVTAVSIPEFLLFKIFAINKLSGR